MCFRVRVSQVSSPGMRGGSGRVMTIYTKMVQTVQKDAWNDIMTQQQRGSMWGRRCQSAHQPRQSLQPKQGERCR